MCMRACAHVAVEKSPAEPEPEVDVTALIDKARMAQSYGFEFFLLAFLSLHLLLQHFNVNLWVRFALGMNSHV